MKKLSNVDILFLESIFDDIPDGEEHKFSLRYKLRKRKIIRLWERRQNTFVQKRPVTRMKYVFIAIIIACIAVLAGFGLFEIFGGFRVTDYDIYSMLYIVEDTASYPDTIEEKFYIDMDMSEYEAEVLCDDSTEYWVEYKKEDYVISVRQKPIETFKQIRLNTENSISEPQSIVINSWYGLWFQTQNDGYYYVFNTGKYIISYNSNISKEDTEKMVTMTKIQ